MTCSRRIRPATSTLRSLHVHTGHPGTLSNPRKHMFALVSRKRALHTHSPNTNPPAIPARKVSRTDCHTVPTEVMNDVNRLVSWSIRPTLDTVNSIMYDPSSLVPESQCSTLIQHMRSITDNSYKIRMLAPTKNMKGRDNKAVKESKEKFQAKMQMQEAILNPANPN